MKKRIEKVTISLEEHEIGALEMLSKIDCYAVATMCDDCPFHLKTDVMLNSGSLTKCFSVLCGSIANREKAKND